MYESIFQEMFENTMYYVYQYMIPVDLLTGSTTVMEEFTL